jgi:phosphate transport system protein
MGTSIHTSRDFEAELRELRSHALAMGARCERGLQLSLEAFWSGSTQLAAEVEQLDRQIDDDEKDIDALVLRILALRQPVAYDLRFVAGALRLVTDLERVGDEAVNIAERAKEDVGAARDMVREQLTAMCQQAQEMLRDGLSAFVDGEATRAEQVLGRDDSVDELYGHIVQVLTEYMTQHPQQVAEAIRVIQVAKYLERVADHATNVAEEAIFVVRGEDVRHWRAAPSTGAWVESDERRPGAARSGRSGAFTPGSSRSRGVRRAPAR